MKPSFRLLLTLAALVLVTTVGGVVAAPVDLLEVDSQVFIQDDGSADVIYSLKFRDSEGRTAIRKIGPFYEPVHFTRALLHGVGSEAQEARISNAGGGYFRAEFDRSTRSGGVYTLELHYRTDHLFVDETRRGQEQLLAVWFNPIRWSLPIDKSVIHLVLPLELPAEVVEHSDITPEMVDAFGLLTDQGSLNEQDHWAFVYSDYHSSRRLTMNAERMGLRSEAVHLIRLYLPRAAMPDFGGAAPEGQGQSLGGTGQGTSPAPEIREPWNRRAGVWFQRLFEGQLSRQDRRAAALVGLTGSAFVAGQRFC